MNVGVGVCGYSMALRHEVCRVFPGAATNQTPTWRASEWPL